MSNKTINAVILVVVVAILIVGANMVYAYHDPANNNYHEPFGLPPGNNAPAPLNVSNIGQSKIGGLTLNTGGAANGLLIPLGNVGIGDTSPDIGTGGQLKVDVEGNVGATKYCDQAGSNCYTTTEMAGGGAGGGVTKIIAGTNVTISPTTGVGDVTVNSTAGTQYYVKEVNPTSSTQTLSCDSGDIAVGWGNLADNGSWGAGFINFQDTVNKRNPTGVKYFGLDDAGIVQLLCLDL